MNENEFFIECLKFLDHFNVDYSKEEINLNNGDLSCLMNPESEFYKLFAGESIFSVAQFVANKLNKKINFTNE